MCCNHPFSQRNKTKRAVGMEVGDDREGGGGWMKFEKKEGVGNIGGRGVRKPLPPVNPNQKRYLNQNQNWGLDVGFIFMISKK